MKGCQTVVEVGLGLGCHPMKVQSRICISENFGTVRYVGEVDGTKGTWLGVEWDNPERGKHNGIYNAKQYFQTKHPISGSFIRPERVCPSRTCAQAIKERYGEQELEVLSEQERKLACSVDKVIEFVGAEKMALKISKLVNLKEAALTNMCITGETNNNELETLTPNLQEIDLSSNLLDSWMSVANIVAHLPSLQNLILSDNLLNIPDTPEDISLFFNTVRTLILNKMQYTWEEILRCSLMWHNIENLLLSYNNISSLKSPERNTMQNLKFLDLSFNNLQSWREIEKLGVLPSLQKLNLSNTNLTEIEFSESELFQSLEELELSHNELTTWLSVNELNKLPKLMKLKINGNPVIKSETWETSRQLVIAKISQLTKLDGIEITKQERRDSERDYLKRYFHQWKECSEKHSNNNYDESFIKNHPIYEKLVQVHGASEESEIVPVKLITKISLLSVQICSPMMPEKPNIQKKVPASMTIAKLKALIHRLYRVPVSDLILTYKTNEKNIFYDLNNDFQTLSYFEIKDGDIINVQW